MAEEAKARAQAIAAKLTADLKGNASAIGTSSATSVYDSSELGKRKDRWSESGSTVNNGNGISSGPYGNISEKKRSKIQIPLHLSKENNNVLDTLMSPQSNIIQTIQDKTGAKVTLRGKGSNNKEDADSNEPIHVLLEGTDEAIASASKEIQSFLQSPQEINRFKQSNETAVSSFQSTVPGIPTSQSLYGPISTMSSGQYQPNLVAGTLNLSSNSSVDELPFEIPNAMVGVVIGRGGENIQKIQREFGVNIQIAKTDEVPPNALMRPITLKGPKNSLLPAKRDIENLIAERQTATSGPMGQLIQSQYTSSSGLYGQQEHKMTMAIPNDKVGLVIGKGGTTIKGIQGRTQANIQIPQQADADDPSRRTIIISASTMQQVDIASREVQNVIDAGITSSAAHGGNSVNIDVPNDRVGLIIGRGGVTIKDIQNRCAVRIQIPTQPDPVTNLRNITIVGAGDGPVRAKYEVEQLISGHSSQRQDSQLSYSATSYGASAVPYGQAQQPPALAYGMSPYGQAAFAQIQPYGLPGMPVYPGFDQRYQQPGLSDPYAQQYQSQPLQPLPVQASTPTPAPTGNVDLTQYYTQFWQYAAYYGEKVARDQYGAWAPPLGTPAPPGIVLPPVGQEQPAATQH